MRALPTCLAALLVALLVALVAAHADGPSREEKVHADKARVEATGWWIYQDLPRAFEEARTTGKPLVVVLRCIPCEDCVKLDDEVVDTDPRLKPLLEQFVRARVVGTNGLDLATFQFDTDQSWLVFLLRADGTIYGRFGTRSDHKAWADDVSVEGLARALEGALEMHAAWPRDAAVLAAKRGPTPTFPVPEAYPELKAKYGATLDFTGGAAKGRVVPSCIHCHQIGEAERAHRRAQGPLDDVTLFPHPHPRSIGLVLDPTQRATVLKVLPGTAADRAGFRAGDALTDLAEQPLLSIADVQWVLHGVPAAGGTLPAQVLRSGQPKTLTLTLAAGWRRADDIGWRASTWQLRRQALGGMKLDALAPAERAKLDLPKEALGLRIAHVGQYAPHDVAKRAGFQKGDVLVSFDGRTAFNGKEGLARETDLLRYALQDLAPGARIAVSIRRDGKPLDLALTLPR